jgi:hypothetical protein
MSRINANFFSGGEEKGTKGKRRGKGSVLAFFQSQNAYKASRKRLVENYLWAIYESFQLQSSIYSEVQDPN